MHNSPRYLLFAPLVIAVAASCSSAHHRDPAVPPPTTPEVTFVSQEPEAPAAPPYVEPLVTCPPGGVTWSLDIFFNLGSAAIREDQKAHLESDAVLFRERPQMRFDIEGHCDERGTRSYNLALGEARAAAIRDYLVRSGVASERIHVVSYGKERPFAFGHTEADWSKNRRAHFVITAK